MYRTVRTYGRGENPSVHTSCEGAERLRDFGADSMQVYRGMDIGSAKIRPEEMEGIPHYLIDVLEPEEEFNVVRFQQMAEAAMEEIYRAGRLPIVVGGTGFYIQALLKGVDFTETEGNSELRRRLEKLAEEKGGEYLHRLLAEKDPLSAEAIHPNNVRRVIRALEYYEETGSADFRAQCGLA